MDNMAWIEKVKLEQLICHEPNLKPRFTMGCSPQSWWTGMHITRKDQSSTLDSGLLYDSKTTVTACHSHQGSETCPIHSPKRIAACMNEILWPPFWIFWLKWGYMLERFWLCVVCKELDKLLFSCILMNLLWIDSRSRQRSAKNRGRYQQQNPACLWNHASLLGQ